jgi:hypothetical protein
MLHYQEVDALLASDVVDGADACSEWRGNLAWSSSDGAGESS